jgi:mycoredoxin
VIEADREESAGDVQDVEDVEDRRKPPEIQKSIVAYITSWCPDCTRSRRLMKKMGVAFQEIDIEQVEGAEDEMRARNGGSGKVPSIFIGDRVLIEPSDLELKRALQEEM